LFTEATVADRNGVLLAQVRVEGGRDGARRRLISVDTRRYPYRQFSWRDWFNGRGDHRPGEKLPPIMRTHLSSPYVSSGPGRPLFVSVSVPIRHPQRQAEVIGVLEAAIGLEQMNSWLSQTNLNADATAVLVDARGHCVLHPDRDHLPTPSDGARLF